MKNKKSIVSIILLIIPICLLAYQDIIEEIYAIVNGEIVTYSELVNAERALTFELTRQLTGVELQKQVAVMKSKLLATLIDQKLLLSKAKEKNYDVDADLDMIIKEIKTRNNFKSDAELAAALRSQGMTMEEFKEQQKLQHMKRKLIYEEIGTKVKANNSEIMEYYRKNIKEYTTPEKISLNCIYLNKENYLTDSTLKDKKQEIDRVLEEDNFKETAKKYTELLGTDNPIFLGEFKKDDLDEKIASVALLLKPDQHSSWIETSNGWYIIQLIKKTESQLIPYKDVRADIGRKIEMGKQEVELTKFIAELKKDSEIDILKEYK